MILSNILKNTPLFKNLSKDDSELVVKYLTLETYSKGTFVFHKGDVGGVMYLVESGQLAVLDDEELESIALLGPGNFVGDLSLLLGEKRTASVKVIIDARLWILHKKDFDVLVSSRPSIAIEMTRELGRRLVTTTQRKARSRKPRITAILGGHKSIKLIEAIYDQINSPISVLPLPRSNISRKDNNYPGVIFVESSDLTETTLAERLSFQIEVFKQVIVVLPHRPDSIARKAIDLADTVVSIGEPYAWLVESGHKKILSIDDSEIGLQRTARKLTNRVVGLALSSGGTRGLAHIGVLQALVEENIPIDLIAGSSAGALFGALFTVGWDFERIKTYVQNLKTLTHFTNWDLNIPPITGLFKGRKATEKFLAKPFEYRNIEDLDIPFYIVAGDILTGEEIVFDSGSLAEAIRASASIPILGDPWHYRGHFFVDGGVVNPLPANVLRERGADIVIASNVVLPLNQSYSGRKDKMPNILQLVFNIVSAFESELVKKQYPWIDVLIQHHVSAKHTLDFDQAEYLIEIGAEETKKFIPDIKKLLADTVEI